MRVLPLAALLSAFLAGCVGDGGGGDDADDKDGYRSGVVFFNEEFTVAAGMPARFPVTVEAGARDVVLEIQQDSGVMPNVRVRLDGCGEVQPPASAGWQSYALCDRPEEGRRELVVSVDAGAPAGSGRLLLRADLPG